ncbi:MAG: arginine--tRNA ligase [Patescibacteria group bacterium]|jgi:arginyl-tRNA synthetase|nr:arginine--tRNA ligase [Patescibacteria group bacterium]
MSEVQNKLYRFLAKYYQREEQNIKNLNEKIKNEKLNRQYIFYGDYILSQVKKQIINLLKSSFPNLEINDLLIEEPPFHIKADFCFACFDLGKQLKKSPLLLAEEIAEIININSQDLFIQSAQATAAYVNLNLKPEIYSSVLRQILEMNDKYGESDLNKDKIVLIDYSSPNIAKPIGLNHLPSTIIGQVLGNIYWQTGASVIRHNYLGDWGTNFGALLWAYLHWADEQKIKASPARELKNLYVRFFEEATQNEKLIDEAREMFKKLEEGDSKLLSLWKKIRDLSIKDFEKVYKQLGIKFDTYLGESYFLENIDKIIDEVLDKQIAKKGDDLSIIVDSLNNLPSFLLRKADGTTLYLTRDLSALKMRLEKFNADVILYVVGSEQSLHFQQLFALAERLGYLTENKKAYHVPFGLILIDGKKMATRKGSLIEMEDLLNEAVERAKSIVVKKNSSVKEKKLLKIAEIIGIGAVVYNNLRSSRLQNIDFNWERVLNFESASAPYLQYSCVRIKSILKKLELSNKEIFLPQQIIFENNLEFQLMKKLMLFPDIILRVQLENAPHYLCNYLEDIAQLFNKFYDETSIIKTTDENLRNSRIALIKSLLLVLEKSLNLLNIQVPEMM